MIDIRRCSLLFLIRRFVDSIHDITDKSKRDAMHEINGRRPVNTSLVGTKRESVECIECNVRRERMQGIPSRLHVFRVLGLDSLKGPQCGLVLAQLFLSQSGRDGRRGRPGFGFCVRNRIPGGIDLRRGPAHKIVHLGFVEEGAHMSRAVGLPKGATAASRDTIGTGI